MHRRLGIAMQSILATVVAGGLFRYNVYYVKSFTRFSPIHVQYVCKYIQCGLRCSNTTQNYLSTYTLVLKI